MGKNGRVQRITEEAYGEAAGEGCVPEGYILLLPETGEAKLRLSVLERGELRMNTALRKKFPDRQVEIRISPDCRILLLKPEGEGAHFLTKAGTTRSQELANRLRRARLEFPVSYLVSWSERLKQWEGRLDVPREK